MSKYSFFIAAENQDAGLRRLLRDNPMPGRIALSYEREPNFFHGAQVGNRSRQVVICTEAAEGGTIVGFGVRSVFDGYVNGVSVPCGYLSGLRVDARYRGMNLLARGYRFFRDLHGGDGVKLYLTTIVSGNTYAKHILTGRRAGLPFYEDGGRYHSYLFPLKRARTRRQGAVIRQAGKADIPAVADCLRRNSIQKQFYPVYTRDTFENGNGFLRGFLSTDFFLAYRNDRLAGVAGIWDQSAFKQYVVRGCGFLPKGIRSLYNFAARRFGLGRLPAVGEPIAVCYAFAIAVESNNAGIFEQLLTAMYNEAGNRGYEYLAVGLHSRDPLCNVAKSLRHILYESDVYVVHWEDGIEEYKSLDSRPPYLEIATL